MKPGCSGLILSLAVCGFAASAMAADKPVDVRDLVTANQFRQMDLDKLAPEELAALNAWLAVYGHGEAAMAADKPVDVRDLVTANQFHRMGLDKLAPEELAAFNAWLATYGHAQVVSPVPAAVPIPATKAVPAAATRPDAGFGQETLPAAEREEPKLIETRILGTFTGWSGRTLFTFENGQVWEQAEPGDFQTHLENPKVVIKRLSFGYLLTLPGQGATVFVKRVH